MGASSSKPEDDKSKEPERKKRDDDSKPENPKQKDSKPEPDNKVKEKRQKKIELESCTITYIVCKLFVYFTH